MTTNSKYANILFPNLGTDQITDDDYATGSSASAPSTPAPDLSVEHLTLSADSGVSRNDFITNVASQTISGTLFGGLNSGTHLWGSVDNGATWTDITGMVGRGGNFSWTGVTLAGSSAIVFKTTDEFGNITAQSSAQAYVLDNSADAVTAVLANNTGTSSTNLYTSDATVKIGGLEQGAVWYYSTNNGSKWTKGSGNSIASSVFKTGTTSLQVKQIDQAGNESDVTTLKFTLDTKAVATTLALASDTGIAGDSITNNGAIAISNLESGASWKYSIDNGATWKRGSGTSIESSAFTSNGDYTVLVKQTDRAGNESGISRLSFTRDATVAAPTVALLHDTGASSADKKTSDGTLRISGIEDGATWQYNIDNKGWITGNSSQKINDKLFSAGTHNVTVQQTDIAGNTSSSKFSFELEAHKPQVVLYSDTGSSQSDNITNQAALYITGLYKYTLFCDINNKRVVSLSSGVSTFGSAAFKEGLNTINFTAIQNNTWNDYYDLTYTFTLDTIRPDAPSLALVSDTGSSRTDRITSNGAVQINNLETGATFEYSVNNSGAWVKGSGNSVKSSVFSEGSNTVLVRQIDKAGNVGDSSKFSFILNAADPYAPQISLDNDTGFSARDNITRDGTVNIAGLEAGASWWYSLSNTSGSWFKGSGSSLAASLLGGDGAKTVYVKQVDICDNVSKTASLSFTLDTKADKAPLVNLEHDTGTSNSDHITNNIGTINVSRIASGSTWQYRIDSGAWIAGGSGRSIAGNLFHEGENTVMVRQRDAAGNESTGSLILTLDTHCTPILSLLHDTGNSSSDKITSDATVVVSGIDDVATWQYRIDQATDWVTGKNNQIPASAFTQGNHTVYVQATDKAGNTGTTSLSFTLSADSGPLIALKNDTGWSNSDNITNDGTVHFTFSPGSSGQDMYEYCVTGPDGWTYNWMNDFRANADKTSYANGLNTFHVREIHSDGTTGETSTFSFTLDSAAPQRPSVALVNETALTYSPDGNKLTYDGTIKVSGLDPATRHYWGFNDCYYSADGDTEGIEFFGDYIPSSVFTLGTHHVYVFQVDSAGNQSDAGKMAFVMVPWWNTTTLSLANDTGSSNSDNITKDATVNVKDFGDQIKWEYSLDNGINWVQGSGHSIPASVFHEGVNTVTLRIIDKNTSNYINSINGTAEFTFTLDTQIPAAPTVYLLHDTGISNSDNVTDDATVVISGLEKGATWRFHTATAADEWIEGGKIWDQDAKVSRDMIPASYIHEGSNTIYVHTQDKAGNASDISILTFTYTTFTPDQKAPTVFLANDAGPSSRDNITNNADVSVVCHTSSTYEWTLDGIHWTKGDWSADFGATIYKDFFHEGVNTLQVRETGNGTNGAISTLTFTLDTKAPEIPGINKLSDRLEITGLEADATWFYNVDHETGVRQGQGNAISADNLSAGDHHLFICQQDLAGNLSYAYHFDIAVSQSHTIL